MNTNMVSGDQATDNREEGIKKRLMRFLMKDKAGIRKCLLRLFLQAKNYNTVEVYDYLIDQGFKVNYRGVSAMVGQMHTRLGILRIYLNSGHNLYSLKEETEEIVKMVLSGR